MSSHSYAPDAFRSPIIKILVGVAEASFHVHKTLLVNQSLYFNAALTGDWKEASSGLVRLSDVKVESFELFVSWIYNASVAVPSVPEDISIMATQHIRDGSEIGLRPTTDPERLTMYRNKWAEGHNFQRWSE